MEKIGAGLAVPLVFGLTATILLSSCGGCEAKKDGGIMMTAIKNSLTVFLTFLVSYTFLYFGGRRLGSLIVSKITKLLCKDCKQSGTPYGCVNVMVYHNKEDELTSPPEESSSISCKYPCVHAFVEYFLSLDRIAKILFNKFEKKTKSENDDSNPAI